MCCHFMTGILLYHLLSIYKSITLSLDVEVLLRISMKRPYLPRLDLLPYAAVNHFLRSEILSFRVLILHDFSQNMGPYLPV